MKVKNKFLLAAIFFFLIFTISITNFNNFLQIKNGNPNQEIYYEKLYNDLKISLTEDWNETWHKFDRQQGEGITVDNSNGNIYVTGYNGTNSGNDVLLINYNSGGVEQWNVTWDSGRDDFGYDVKVDSNGYIYVAGASGPSSDRDAILLKFNSSGGLEWNKTYDSGLDDCAWALEIDSEDMIYVVGTTYTSDQALLLLKFNSTGHLQWTSIYDDSGVQIGRDIVLDSNNNIYITGQNDTASYADVLFVKFDSEGKVLLNRTWGGNSEDIGVAIALDSKNSAYMTGTTWSFGGFFVIFVVKYDTNGNWQWNQTYGTMQDRAEGIDVDSADNIYIGGHKDENYIILLKCSTSGELMLFKQWDRDPSWEQYCHDLVIDYLDKVYITGRYQYSIYRDLFLAKFSIESPGGFTISSDAGVLDTDGNFTLSWTPSARANNYSIYQHSNYITEIDDSLTLLEEETDLLSLPLIGYSNGTYYFIGVAFNTFGNATSNCMEVEVQIPPEEDGEEDGNGDEDGEENGGGIIPSYNLYMVLIFFISISAIVIQLRRRKL